MYIAAGGSVQGFDFDHATWTNGVVDSVADGSLSLAALDTAVGRVLTVKDRLGLFETPMVTDTAQYYTLTESANHAAVALEGARKAMVLLQNHPDADIVTASSPAASIRQGARGRIRPCCGPLGMD